MTQRFNKKEIIVATGIALAVLVGNQAPAATSSATASATITSAPITITNTQPLSFGDIAAGTAASVITVNPNGNRTLDSGDAILGATVGTPATFDVTGEAGKGYTVTLPAAVTLSDSAGNTMTANNFTSNASGTITATGDDTFDVGASLTVAGNQTAGSYSGTFSVDIVY